MNYLDLSMQVFTAVFTLLCFFYYKTKFMLLLTLLTVLTALVESFGEYTVLLGKSSFFVYHIFSLFQFSLIYKIYQGLVKDNKCVKFFTVLHVLFILLWIIIFFKYSLFFYVIIFGGFNTSIFIFFYLREILLSDKILNYKRLLPFWVSVGLLVFYLPSIPFFSLFKHMKDRGLFFILNILVVIMNIFIIYGLVCSNKKEEY